MISTLFPTISLRIERWKFNKEYGIYVSTLGNFKDRHKRRLPIKINEKGYCLVKTEAPNEGWKLAHRIVMLTWCPIPDAENLTVDHLNHNKRDNSLDNLEWVTKKENLDRARKDFIKSANDYQPIKINKEKLKLKLFQETIIGYEVNGVFYKTPEETIQAAYNIQTERPLEKYIEAVENLYTGRNNAGIKALGKKVLIKIIRERK